jgi:hypothetical protein
LPAAAGLRKHPLNPAAQSFVQSQATDDLWTLKRRICSGKNGLKIGPDCS